VRRLAPGCHQPLHRHAACFRHDVSPRRSRRDAAAADGHRARPPHPARGPGPRPAAARPVRHVRRGGSARGDLGHSYYHGRPVVDLLRERLPATLELAVVSLLLSLLLGVPLGILAGARPDTGSPALAMSVSMLGISLPTFWLGLLLIMGFAVTLEWLPPMGRGPTRELFGVPFSFLTRDGWSYLVLPAVTLALHHIAMLIRLVRSELFETLRLPFIRAARSRGLSEVSIVGRHAMRNSMIPLLTVTAVEFGQLIAFSVVTETIFQWPGLGKLLIDSVYVDRPLVVAYLAMTGVLFLTLNFLVDVAYVFADPRILHGKGEALS
jgi:peptide/nickel transport system permease protein